MTVAELLQAGRKSEALQQAQAAANQQAGPRAFADLAYAEIGARNFEAAFVAASRAVSLEPAEPAFHFLCARTALAAKHFQVAFDEASGAHQQSRELQDDYYTQSCLLIAAASCAGLGDPNHARWFLDQIEDNVKVMAGRLLTPEVVRGELLDVYPSYAAVDKRAWKEEG